MESTCILHLSVVSVGKFVTFNGLSKFIFGKLLRLHVVW